MAKIEIERKPRRALLPLILALVVIGLAVAGIYLYLERGGAETVETTPGALPPADRDTTIPPTGLTLPQARDGQTFQLLFWPRGPQITSPLRV
jgi:hypothetical protein